MHTAGTDSRSLSEIDFAECRINHLQAISDWSLSVSVDSA